MKSSSVNAPTWDQALSAWCASAPEEYRDDLNYNRAHSARFRVATLPELPAHVQELLAHDSHIRVRSAIQQGAWASPELLLRCLIWDRIEADPVRHVSLDFICQAPSWLRSRVAKREDTPQSWLARLAQDSDWWVRQVVAYNPNTPLSALLLLSEDSQENVSRWAKETILRITPDVDSEELKDERVRKEYAVMMALRQLALSSDAPPELLEALAEHEDETIRGRVAHNGNVPVEVLQHLLNDDSSFVRQMAAAQAARAGWFVEELAWHYDLEMLQQVICMEGVHEDLLARVAQRDEPKLALRVAKHPLTPVHTLAYLSQHASPAIRLAVAQAWNTSSSILLRLVLDKDATVAWAALHHPQADAQVFHAAEQQLLTAPLPERLDFARHPQMPDTVLSQFASQEDPELTWVVLSHPGLSVVTLRQIATRFSGGASVGTDVYTTLVGFLPADGVAALCENPNLTHGAMNAVLSRFMPLHPTAEAKTILRKLASREDIRPEVARQLAASDSKSIRSRLASNPNCPADALATMADEGILNSINPRLPVEVLTGLFTTLSVGQRANALQRQDLPLEVRQALLDDLPTELLVEKNLLPQEFIQLANRSSETARTLAAQHSGGLVLSALASSLDFQVRLSLLDNPQLPEAVLQQLGQDQELIIRWLANERLWQHALESLRSPLALYRSPPMQGHLSLSPDGQALTLLVETLTEEALMVEVTCCDEDGIIAPLLYPQAVDNAVRVQGKGFFLHAADPTRAWTVQLHVRGFDLSPSPYRWPGKPQKN